MKGLLLKDWYQLIKYCRSILLVSAIFLVASFFFTTMNMFFLYYPTVMIGMIPMTLYSYDERCHWTSYVGTMPCTRAQIVSAKYIISLVSVGSVWLITTLAIFLNTSFAGTSRFMVSGMVLLTGLLMPAISLPGMFKFGVEKMRLFYMAAIFIACAIGGGLGAWVSISSIPALSSGIIAAVEYGLIMVLFPLSWWLSIRVYKQKEL